MADDQAGASQSLIVEQTYNVQAGAISLAAASNAPAITGTAFSCGDGAAQGSVYFAANAAATMRIKGPDDLGCAGYLGLEKSLTGTNAGLKADGLGQVTVMSAGAEGAPFPYLNLTTAGDPKMTLAVAPPLVPALPVLPLDKETNTALGSAVAIDMTGVKINALETASVDITPLAITLTQAEVAKVTITGESIKIGIGPNSLEITPAGITLTAGPAKIAMTPAGISIESPATTVSGTATAELSGATTTVSGEAEVTISGTMNNIG